MKMTLAQYLLKHNPRIKHHDRLFYGKYLYSQRVFLPITHREYWRYDHYQSIEFWDENPMGDWITTNNAITDLKKVAKANNHSIKFRREGNILNLYSNSPFDLDHYLMQIKNIFQNDIRVAEINCAPNVDDKNTRVRKNLPHNRYRTEVVLRTWNYGKKPCASNAEVKKFYENYRGQVWNESLEKEGGVCGWTYTSLWLTDDALVPVCYLVFGQAVQKVLTYKLESEMDT